MIARFKQGLAPLVLLSTVGCAAIPFGGEDHAVVVGLYPAIGSAWYSDTSTSGEPLTWKRRIGDATLKTLLTTFANGVTFGAPTVLGLIAEPFRRWDPCYAADTCANMLVGFTKTKKAVVTRR